MRDLLRVLGKILDGSMDNLCAMFDLRHVSDDLLYRGSSALDARNGRLRRRRDLIGELCRPRRAAGDSLRRFIRMRRVLGLLYGSIGDLRHRGRYGVRCLRRLMRGRRQILRRAGETLGVLLYLREQAVQGLFHLIESLRELPDLIGRLHGNVRRR